MKKIYLDYAAATPMRPEVLRAMQPYFTDDFYNPSATYLAARDVRQKLNAAREVVAGVLGSRPAEIVFTAGATEANNLAVAGIMKNFPDAKVLVSAIEHESVLAPAKLFNCQEIPVTPRGVVDLGALEKLIDGDVVLVSVMYVNNELGTIQPLREIAQLLNRVKTARAVNAASKLSEPGAGVFQPLPLYFHTDAAQAGNYLDLHVSRLGVDLLSLNGGKIYGPKQSGAIYVRAGIQLVPQIVGGGQEFGLRSGTENVAAIAGLAEALSLAQNARADESTRVMELRKKFERELAEIAPNARINDGKSRAPHIVSITFPGVDNERFVMQLDQRGIMCAVGSACSASSDEPSHVLSAIGLSDSEARTSLRFSFGRQTTLDDIDHTIKALAKILSIKN